MNETLKKFKNFIFLILLVGSHISSQWQPDVRLTNDSAASYTYYNWCIASSGNIVNVVWEENRNGNYEIYYKRSTNKGVSWNTDYRLTNNSGQSYGPSISLSGLSAHVVWEDDRDGNYEIYYKHSTDGGTTWNSDTRLTNNSAVSSNATLSVAGSVIHTAWNDDRDGNIEIYYKRSTDEGTTWGLDTRLTNSPGQSFDPSISVSGMVVHVVWTDNRNAGTEIYYKRSSDGGSSWSTDIQLTNYFAPKFSPSVSVSGSVVHIVWYDNRDGNYEIYYKRSTDGGLSWGIDTRLTNNPAISAGPSLSTSGSFVHVVWEDDRDGNNEIYYKHSIDGGLSWSADTRLTNNPAGSSYSSVSVSGSIVNVVWCDNRDGNSEIYYKRDSTGNPVGLINIHSGIPKTFSLEQNYPNPFNPATNINFSIPENSYVSIKIYDLLGREISLLTDKFYYAGSYNLKFDGEDLPSGTYMYRINAGDFIDSKKMILMK